MRVLVAGDSHTVPLMKGQLWRTRKGESDPGIEFEFRVLGNGRALSRPFFDDRGDHAAVRGQRFAGGLERIPPEGPRFDWIGLSGLFHATRVLARGYATPALALAGDHVISTGMLRQGIADDVMHMLALVDLLRRHHRVFTIESPWPFAHAPIVRHNGREKVAAMHAAYRGFVLDALRARDVPVVEVDPEWIEQGTFTSPRFRSETEDDPHHGNNLFGAQMMARVEAMLRARTP